MNEKATLSEMQEWAIANSILNVKDWIKATKPDRFIQHPWTSFGISAIDFFKKRMLSKDETQQWCRRNGVSSWRQYIDADKPALLPKHPWYSYKTTCRQFFKEIASLPNNPFLHPESDENANGEWVPSPSEIEQRMQLIRNERQEAKSSSKLIAS